MGIGMTEEEFAFLQGKCAGLDIALRLVDVGSESIEGAYDFINDALQAHQQKSNAEWKRRRGEATEGETDNG